MKSTLFRELNIAAKIACKSVNKKEEIKRVFLKGQKIVTGSIIRKKPKTTILLVHDGRVGSTVVGKILDKQKDIYWDGEVLTKVYMIRNELAKQLTSSTEKWNAFLINRSLRACGKTYGFELKPEQFLEMEVSLEDHINWLNETYSNLHVFFLFRRNLLRRLISIKQGMSKKSWHSGQPSCMPIEINPEHIFPKGRSLLDWLKRLSNTRETVRKGFIDAGLNPRTMYFEDDILKDPNSAARIIYTATGLPYKADPKVIRKAGYLPLNKLITNFEEVAASLSGTEFEFMLSDSNEPMERD